jgi:hypothetical protein
MAETSFLTAKPIAGRAVAIKLLCDADTYYTGMPVTYSSGTYAYSATVIQGIVWEDKVLAAEGYVLCLVSGSEFPEDKIVDSANATLTVTAAMKNAAMLLGIILR